MKQFYTCKDVMDVMGVGESKAYKIIKCLNQELNTKGYITVSGKYPVNTLRKGFTEWNLIIQNSVLNL